MYLRRKDHHHLAESAKACQLVRETRSQHGLPVIHTRGQKTLSILTDEGLPDVSLWKTKLPEVCSAHSVFSAGFLPMDA